MRIFIKCLEFCRVEGLINAQDRHHMHKRSVAAVKEDDICSFDIQGSVQKINDYIKKPRDPRRWRWVLPY